jgi:hypothetical protein
MTIDQSGRLLLLQSGREIFTTIVIIHYESS